MGIFGFIRRNLDQYGGRFARVCIAGAAAGATGFMIPVVLAEATRRPLTAGKVPAVVAAIVVFYALNLAFARVVRGSGEALSQQFGNHLRLKYFDRIHRQPVDQLTSQHSGYVLSLVGKVTDGMQPILFSVFWDLAPGVVTIGLFFYFTTQAAPLIGLLNLVFLVTFVCVGTVLSRRMVPLSAELNTRRAELMESYVDFGANIMTVKKLGLYEFAAGRLHRATTRSYQQIDRVQRFHGNRWLLLHSLFGAAYLGTLAFMLWRVADGALAASILILFVGAYARVRALIEGLSETVKLFMEMRAYIHSLDDILDGAAVQSGIDPGLWSEIGMTGVAFDYAGAGPRLTVPHFCLRRGQTIGVVGASGQGKTTFVSLLAGHLDPAEGARTVDGRPYEQIDPDFFAQQTALVSQETELFDLSLRDNLTLGGPATDGDIRALLADVDLAGWLAGLPDGLDTRVGEKGMKLSAGQKQRVNLVRGVLLDRELCILDEPTAHLDAGTEAVVVEFIRRRLAGRTVVIVTHRPALLALCRDVYEIRDHQVSRRGWPSRRCPSTSAPTTPPAAASPAARPAPCTPASASAPSARTPAG